MQGAVEVLGVDGLRARRRSRLAAQLKKQAGGVPILDFAKTGIMFVHIPKNAGTSISLRVYGRSIGHYTWRQAFRIAPTSYLSWVKFCVVRDPVDRFVSAYDFLARGGMNGGDRETGAMLQRRFGDAEKLALALGDREVRRQILGLMHFRPQHEFICDDQGVCRVDQLVRYENLEQDLIRRVPAVAWRGTIPQANKTLGPRTAIDSLSSAALSVLRTVYAPAAEIHVAAAFEGAGLYGERLVSAGALAGV